MPSVGRQLGFAVTGPSAWNSRPLDIPLSSSLLNFKKHLKTFLFTQDTVNDTICAEVCMYLVQVGFGISFFLFFFLSNSYNHGCLWYWGVAKQDLCCSVHHSSVTSRDISRALLAISSVL
uniref:Uncharacterized protein n=1 Tax=Sphenodon punctatus TaxID=8508 RepID=A0A8D0HDN3_SPHPU